MPLLLPTIILASVNNNGLELVFHEFQRIHHRFKSIFLVATKILAHTTVFVVPAGFVHIPVVRCTGDGRAWKRGVRVVGQRAATGCHRPLPRSAPVSLRLPEGE